MGKFLNSLEMKQIQSATPTRKALYVLTEDLVYRSNTLNTTIIVPKGFVTDLASMPRIPILYALLGDLAHAAAVLHDFLYTIPHKPSKDSCLEVTRAMADKVLRGAIVDGMLIESDEDKRIQYALDLIQYVLIADCFWVGVRIGGASHWKELN